MANNMEHDPEDDVTTEILSRLPVKSLMRFKCICKFWFGLVTNADLVQKHLNNCKNNNTRLLIINPGGGFEDGPSFHLYSDTKLTDLSYQYIDPHKLSVKVISGPFNGLFCLHWESSITLWNPTINEYRTLPKI